MILLAVDDFKARGLSSFHGHHPRFQISAGFLEFLEFRIPQAKIPQILESG